MIKEILKEIKLRHLYQYILLPLLWGLVMSGIIKLLGTLFVHDGWHFFIMLFASALVKSIYLVVMSFPDKRFIKIFLKIHMFLFEVLLWGGIIQGLIKMLDVLLLNQEWETRLVFILAIFISFIYRGIMWYRKKKRHDEYIHSLNYNKNLIV